MIGVTWATGRMLMACVLALAMTLGIFTATGCVSSGQPPGPTPEIDWGERVVTKTREVLVIFKGSYARQAQQARDAHDLAAEIKANQRVARFTEYIGYADLAVDGVAALRGDREAQARVLAELAAKFTDDPALQALAVLLPELLSDLVPVPTAAGPAPP